MSTAITLARLDAFAFRAPLETPVVASFGTMRDRPMVLVRATDRDGTVGWGEVWCNFPTVGAEHRARLVSSVLTPLLVGRTFDTPRYAFLTMTAETAVLAIQCAEPGPFAQAIAGVDMALTDLAARRAGMPVWRWLGGRSPTIGVYASGLNPTAPEVLAATMRATGHRAFKLKVGFGRERDLANLRALRVTLGDAATLLVDANQAWSIDDAVAMVPELAPFSLGWLEEPLRADRPATEWLRLRDLALVPLAAGENLAGDEAFDAALATAAIAVVQPDLAKWGGFSGTMPVARRIMAAGLRFCPHYLGGGMGQLASAHLLAAAGGTGLLEIDANPNPLRERLVAPLLSIADGRTTLGEEPGLGMPDPLALVGEFQVAVV